MLISSYVYLHSCDLIESDSHPSLSYVPTQISILSFVPFLEPFTRVYRSSNKKFNLRLTIIQLSFLWHLRNSRFYLSDCLTSATFNSCPSLESLLRYSMDIVQSREMSYRYTHNIGTRRRSIAKTFRRLGVGDLRKSFVALFKVTIGRSKVGLNSLEVGTQRRAMGPKFIVCSSMDRVVYINELFRSYTVKCRRAKERSYKLTIHSWEEWTV